MEYLQMVGERVRHFRKKSGLTQKELAEKLGVAPRYIGNIEQGYRSPSLEMLVEICRWFGVSTSDILPVAGNGDVEIKEQWINEIVAACRALEPTQVGFLKSMVCSYIISEQSDCEGASAEPELISC